MTTSEEFEMTATARRTDTLDFTQPLRVYRDSSDKTGTVMCLAHRDRFYVSYPGAVGNGEFGGRCEFCGS